MKHIKLLIFAAAFIIMAACAGKGNKSDDKLVYAEANDPELEQAKKEALAKFDYFVKAFNTNASDTSMQFSLKSDFIENGEHEHMWISLAKIEGDAFYGILANNPEIIKKMKYGDSVKISKNEIEDWMIIDNKTGEWEGGFSVKVFQDRENK